jgi:hypothetical protein
MPEEERLLLHDRQRVLRLCDRVQALIEPPSDRNIRKMMLGVDDIDPGEADLFALLVERPAHLLMTGDKRAILALASVDTLGPLCKSICGRVICLEVAIQHLIREKGMDSIAHAIAPLRKYNRMIGAVFSSGENTSEQDCLAGLSSYVKDLVRKTGPSFLFR